MNWRRNSVPFSLVCIFGDQVRLMDLELIRLDFFVWMKNAEGGNAFEKS